jgi:hypothetical protein
MSVLCHNRTLSNCTAIIRPSPNRHLGHSLEKRDPSRHEDATAEKAVPFSVPLFDIKPL